jgi:hypothetical protein
MKEIVLKDKFNKVVIKRSSRCCGYVASTYTWYGEYVGCKHLNTKQELDNYIEFETTIGKMELVK